MAGSGLCLQDGVPKLEDILLLVAPMCKLSMVSLQILAFLYDSYQVGYIVGNDGRLLDATTWLETTWAHQTKAKGCVVYGALQAPCQWSWGLPEIGL